MNDELRDSFHVILVEPEKSLNIGAVARAMMNLGFRHLHLVAPPQYDRTMAMVTACWAEPLLDTMVIHETFAAAIATMEEVVGFSGRPGKNPAHFIPLPEWSGALPKRALHKTALVFGTEKTGLSQEHLNQCRWIIRIPSTTEYPDFNLSQSVLLALYEITRTFAEGTIPDSAPTNEPMPTWNDYFQLDRLLDSVMKAGGFIRPGSPGPTPNVIKNLFRRLELSPQEMGILLGLFGRLNSTLLRQRESDRDDSD